MDGYRRYSSNVDAWINGDDGRYEQNGEWVSGEPTKFYYIRNDYELRLVNGSDSDSREVTFQDSIETYLGTPSNPTGVDNAKFEGWYLDEEFQYPNTYKTMPKGLVLYAKWSMPTYKVTFMDGETKLDEDEVEYNDKVTSISDPTKVGYVFNGWYSDPECETAFDFDMPITEDTTIYAGWTESTITSYVVKYVTIVDGEQVPVASEKEVKDAHVGVQIQEKPVSPTVEEYQNYAPTESSIIKRLSNDPSKNIFVFEYILAQDIPYTVTYVKDGTSETVSGPHPYTSNAVRISVEADESLIPGYEIVGSLIQEINLSETKAVVFYVKAKT